MKIEYLEIHKFRSIESCKVSFNSITAIVGQNNSGKSALIRALNAFFNPNEELSNYIQGKHSYTAKSSPKITICFSDLDGTNGLDEYKNGDTLEVQQAYSSSKKSRTNTRKIIDLF